MRKHIVMGPIMCAFLAGCHHAPEAASNNGLHPGRYSGIGVFDAGRLWAEMSAPGSKANPAMATLKDDEHIIVVLDSHTGEVRQCGDHSGYCVAMNPWMRSGPQNTLPVKLAKHASDLAAEDRTDPTVNVIAK